MTRCSMTGLPMEAGDGIYEDGEWISWDYLNQQIAEQDARNEVIKRGQPKSPQLLAMIDEARAHYRNTQERSPLLGEIGELYAEEQYGIVRHEPHTQGSDGRLGNELVEIKTITPGKKEKMVKVKRAGNFQKLVLVRIWGNFRMEARLIDRRRLPKGDEPWAYIHWDEADYGCPPVGTPTVFAQINEFFKTQSKERQR